MGVISWRVFAALWHEIYHGCKTRDRGVEVIL